MRFFLLDETAATSEARLAAASKPPRGASGVVESGLRFYNAELGRWLSRDPLGELAFNMVSRTSIVHDDSSRNGLCAETPGGCVFIRFPSSSSPFAIDVLATAHDSGLQISTGHFSDWLGIDRALTVLEPGTESPLAGNACLFVNNAPIGSVDYLGLQCILNCFPFYGIDSRTCMPSIVWYCYPIGIPKGTCPCAIDDGWPPPLRYWWQFDEEPPNQVGGFPFWFYPDFDPCDPPQPPMA